MINRESILSLIGHMKSKGLDVMTEYESKRILSSLGIPITKEVLVTSPKEAVNVAEDIGFPVVMKVVSPHILHKTEAKCVRINIRSAEEVRKAFHEILESANRYEHGLKIDGILIQEMIQEGIETIIGTTCDETFGPTIMFGLGGIYVEVFKDVSFRIIPLGLLDAEEMIQDIKGYKILRGARGREALNIEAVMDTLMKVSSLVEQMKMIKALDINPLFVSKEGVKAADARIVLI